MICRLNARQFTHFEQCFKPEIYEVREVGPDEEGIIYVDADPRAWVVFAMLDDLPTSEDPADQRLAAYIGEVGDALGL